MNKYKSGSKWNKWDLHIQTPSTKLSDQYRAFVTEDIWDTFCEKLENKTLHLRQSQKLLKLWALVATSF